MEVVEALAWRGGVADAALMRHLTSARQLRTAVADGSVERLARGRYALRDADEARRAAARLSGVVSHLSAAQLNGWELKHRPPRPQVTVPRGRKVEPWRRAGVDLRWRVLEDDVWNGQTTAGRTVVDCAKDCPFDEALTVADSALRHGNATRDELVRLAERVPSVGRARCLRVAQQASPEAANPFESVLRAQTLEVPGLWFEPQVVVSEEGFVCRPDLVDVERRIVAEADSFEFHGRRAALKRDCERYTALAVRGWLVLRFSWEHVMYEPHVVHDALLRAVDWRPPRRTTSASRRRRAG